MLRIIVSLILACLSTVSWSQQAGEVDPFLESDGLIAVEEEELRRYTVEIIVFEYSDAAASGEELFLPLPPPPPPEEPELEYITLRDYKAEREALKNFEDVMIEEIRLHSVDELFMLEEEDLSMKDTFNRLNRLDAYRPMMHGGWTQSTVDREFAQPIRLRAIGDPPLRLDGTLTLYLSRYLHLIVDVALETEDTSPAAAEAADEDGDVAYYGDSRTRDDYSYYDGANSLPAIVQYRIEEDRIFRSGETRYFDHPKFGVIAKVTRYELEETEEPLETDENFLLPVNEPNPPSIN